MRSSLVKRAVWVALLLVPAMLVQLRVGNAAEMRTVITEGSLPESLGDWVSTAVPLTDEELSMLQSPGASQRIYLNPRTGDQVQVLLLQVGNTQNAHDPKICMRGSGFELSNYAQQNVDWASKTGQKAKISEAVFSKGTTDVTMYYWMQTASDTVADMSAGLKWEGIKRALRGQPTKGIAVRVICLPSKREGRPGTPPEAGIGLWKGIDGFLHVEQLARSL